MSRKITSVSIKLVSIDFVPTWEDVSQPGIKHTVIGQMSIDTKDLPEKMQEQLIEICKTAWIENMSERGQDQ